MGAALILTRRENLVQAHVGRALGGGRSRWSAVSGLGSLRLLITSFVIITTTVVYGIVPSELLHELLSVL